MIKSSNRVILKEISESHVKMMELTMIGMTVAVAITVEEGMNK